MKTLKCILALLLWATVAAAQSSTNELLIRGTNSMCLETGGFDSVEFYLSLADKCLDQRQVSAAVDMLVVVIKIQDIRIRDLERKQEALIKAMAMLPRLDPKRAKKEKQ